MIISDMLRVVWRNLLFLWVGNERYYPASRWDRIYREGYQLDIREQDARYGALLALMERYDSPRSILDVGCGEGILEQKFRRLSKSPMLGIDYSEEAINLATAKRIPACEFICANYRQCKLQQEFGIIVLNESLYYVDNVVETLDELSQHLSSDGVFIVSMFDAFSTRHIWRALRTHYAVLRSIVVRDEINGKKWLIRVLQPKSRNKSREQSQREDKRV
jgi:trans-aconitate methyltransferase